MDATEPLTSRPVQLHACTWRVGAETDGECSGSVKWRTRAQAAENPGKFGDPADCPRRARAKEGGERSKTGDVTQEKICLDWGARL